MRFYGAKDLDGTPFPRWDKNQGYTKTASDAGRNDYFTHPDKPEGYFDADVTPGKPFEHDGRTYCKSAYYSLGSGKPFGFGSLRISALSIIRERAKSPVSLLIGLGIVRVRKLGGPWAIPGTAPRTASRCPISR